MTASEIRKISEELSGHPPLSVLRWVKENIKDEIAMTTSFQISGVVIMHMLHRLDMAIPSFFIDTGYHFPETLDFKDRITKLFDLKLRIVRAQIPKKELEKKHGKFLYTSNPTVCCKINKIDPLNLIKKEKKYNYWISGLRRDQGGERKNFSLLMMDARKQIRIHPLISWTWADVWKYTLDNEIPYHPLYDKGYSSIGCFPPSCTSRGDITNGERSGRWKGKSKTECGLHLDLK
jgi:phosphoadenosine phosphosulfate reductase